MQNKGQHIFVCFLGLYFACLILGAINIGAIGSILKILGLIPILIWIITSHKVRINTIEISFFLFSCMCLASYLWSINPDSSLQRAITQISFFLMICSVCSYTYSEKDIKLLKDCMIWSSRITAIITILFASYMSGRMYLSGYINEDPNYLCAYFLFGLIHCIVQIIIGKAKIIIKLINVFEIFIYLFIIVSTGSRGGALAVLSAAVIATIVCIYNRRISIKTFVLLSLIPILIAIGVYFMTFLVSSAMLDRYSIETLIHSDGTGRYQIWKDALNTFVESNLLRQFGGFGTGTALNIAKLNHFKFVNVFHNSFIENLLELGVIGLIFYILYVLSLFQKSIKMKDIYAFSILIGLVVLSCSTSVAAFKPYWNITLFICVLLQRKENMYVKDNNA